MFAAVMTVNEGKNCKDFLEQLLGMEIGKVEFIYEKTIFSYPEFHGIRLDVFGKDENNTRYNVEMQVEKTSIEKRSRYYHSLIDKDSLEKGYKYNELGESYVIFICDYDPFHGKKYRYTIENACKEMPEFTFDDGRHTIILSTEGENPEEENPSIVEFLKFVRSSLAESENDFEDSYVKQIQDTIKQIKNDRGREVEYMLLEEMIREREVKALETGIEKGRKETYIITASEMLEKIFPIETISKICHMTVEEVLALKK